MQMTERDSFLAWVVAQAERATPYCWPHESNGYLGKGLENPKEPEALDCSGTVTCGLYNATGGRLDWRADYNASRLWKELKPVEKPRPGDLAFYGAHDGSGGLLGGHVMVVASDSVRVVGASGGNRDTYSLEVSPKRERRRRARRPRQLRGRKRGRSGQREWTSMRRPLEVKSRPCKAPCVLSRSRSATLPSALG
jgi:hypothetical protein